jgi:DNA replication protein DnaC
VAHGDGTYVKRLQAIAKTDLLIIDDWGLAPLTQRDRTDLLEILDDRVGSRSTIITSQLPPDHWHAWINDPTLADAILNLILLAQRMSRTESGTILSITLGPSQSIYPYIRYK